MEVFDIYDNLGNPLHKTVERGSSLPPGEFHLVVHIWIRNSEGNYLIQQRNKLSDPRPFMWAVTGGAVTTGETSLESAIRETKEEIGLTLQKEDLKLIHRYVIPNDFAGYIADIYLVEEDVLLDDLDIDILEVKQCAYQSMTHIREMIAQKQFWDYDNKYIRKGYLELIEKS